jgi:hypothetical protein
MIGDLGSENRLSAIRTTLISLLKANATFYKFMPLEN